MKKSNYVFPSVVLMISMVPYLAIAATVDAEICISMTVLSQSPVDVISGGGNVCASVSGTAIATNPGETIVFDDFFEDIGILGGGTNTSGSTVDYTVQFDWTYNIVTTVLGPNETASGLVRADIFGLEFTSGSGSGSQIVNDSLPNNTAADYFITVYAEGNATSVAPVPLPASIWLFGSGIFGFIGLMGSRKES